MEIVGWREWVSLPLLKIDAIKAKIDSGARTSAIHAEDIDVYKRGKKFYVRFTIYPGPSRKKKVRLSHPLLDQRKVRNSLGSVTFRPVISTQVQVGDWQIPIELNLVNRDVMGYRMLIGRQAIQKQFLIHPGKSFLMRKRRGKGA